MAFYDPYLIHKSRDEHMLVKNLCGGATEREKSFEQLLPSFNSSQKLPSKWPKVWRSETYWTFSLDDVVFFCVFWNY